MSEKRKSEFLRIVPPAPEPEGSGWVKTQGTQVLTESGVPIRGVTKVVLTAEVDGLWRAEITCHVQPPDITCLASVALEIAPTRWERFLIWVRYGGPRLRRVGPAAE